MAAAKHSPAPWTLNEVGQIVIDNGLVIAHVTRADHRLRGKERREDQEICDGNARVMAAALEMKEALEAFNLKEEWIVGGTADALVLRVPMTVIQKAAAALAKATGSAS